MILYDVLLLDVNSSSAGKWVSFSTPAKAIEFINEFRSKCKTIFGRNLHVDFEFMVQPSKYEKTLFLNLEGTEYKSWEIDMLKKLGYIDPGISLISHYTFDEKSLTQFFEDDQGE